MNKYIKKNTFKTSLQVSACVCVSMSGCDILIQFCH